MSKKSIYLISFVLVLGLTVGVAEAVFDTVGVYDPDDDPHHNQVDQSGVYDSHTGNAGPRNIIDLPTFQSLIGPAFAADAGGVVSGESPDDSLGSDDIVIANFGVNRTKSVNFAGTSGLSFGSGPSGGNRLPTSGDRRFSKPGGSGGDYVFDIGAVTGGAPGEVITYFAGTVLYRDNRDMNPQVTATFSGGGTVTAIADMAMGAPGHSKDTFFGFVAPPGEGIMNVTFALANFTNLDDMAFITSAFVVVSEEASNPSPAKGATDVPRDVVLSWTPGEYAPPINGHKVYLSDNFNDVNDGIGGIAQDANSYAPGRLALGTTYYWRVDEVNGPPDFTVYEGSVWSFTTEPVGYAIENVTATASSAHQADMGPENTINDSGLDANDLHSTEPTDMWLSGNEPLGAWIQYELDKVYKLHEMRIWNSNQAIESLVGLGLKGVTIEHSTNGIDWTTLAGVPEFAQAPGAAGYAHNTTVDLGGAAAKYVRLTANSNWGFLPQYGLSEVCFFYIPVYAREPNPDSGATDVDVDVVLSFRAGREAAKHDVYLSTDQQAVIDGTAAVISVTETSYGPLALDLAQTHYWRVDEVNEAETPATWQGDLWNFATREFLIVEDFESYNDLDPGDPESKRIFNVWVDGFGIDTNGSVVGYENAPFCERTIVHSGKQSMPLAYDNSGTARYSEAELTLTPPQDWTKHGAKALSLWFYGDPNNVAEQMYVKINGSKVTYDGDADNLVRIPWQTWNIDLTSLGIDLQNVTKLSIGFGDEASMTPGGSGVVFFDDIRLYPYSRQLVTPAEPTSANLVAHYEFEGNTNDSSGNGLHGTVMGAPAFVAGKVGQAISLRGLNDFVEITGYKGILGPKAVTVSVWINTTSTETGTIVGWGPNVDGQRFGFRVNENRLRMENAGGNVQGDSNVNDGGWHHVAVTVQDNVTISYPDVILYVDGIDDTRLTTDPDAFNLAADQDVRIGSRPSGNDRFFLGLIDDVRIYDRALTHEEIAWLAGRTKPFDKPF